MVIAGIVALILGAALQVIVPLNLVDLEGVVIGELPAPVFTIFFSLFLVCVGILMVYLGWYRKYAESFELSN